MVSIVHAARDIGRLRDISTVLVRHGFGEIVQRLGLARTKRPRDAAPGDSRLTLEVSGEEERRGDEEKQRVSRAVRARRVLEDLGPSFVKLGQIASTRPDLLPQDLISEFKKLQDSVAPVSFEAIKEQVEAALGTQLGELFSSFDPVPLAAASIAQVHRAALKTEEGEADVVVKVQRPNIAQTIASDLDILHALAVLIERAIPESKIYSPAGLVQQFDRAINNELDFTLEADNALRFARNLENNLNVRFPRVYRQASAKQVLTLEYLDGIKISQAIAEGCPGRRIAKIALEVIVHQIFEDGFFHADPHPGNVLVIGSGEKLTLALIDLGMVGRLSPKMRDLTVDVMVGALRRDYDAIADALYAIGTPTKKIDMEAFRAEVAFLAEKYLDRALKDIELSGMIRDLVRAATKYGIEIPTDFLLVGKALMTVEGIGKEIDPELDIMEEARPLFLELLKRRYSPERLGHDLLRRLERLSGATYNVPQQLEEVLDDLRLGRLQVRTEDKSIAPSADRLGRRVFSAIVFSSLVLSGAWMISADHVYPGAALLVLAVIGIGIHVAMDLYRGFRERPLG